MGETRPEFDIDVHSSVVLKELIENQPTERVTSIPFAALVEGQPDWEVCRRFLTCLQLTNQGNTEIEYEGEEERLNTFKVRLVSTERKPKRLLCADTDEVAVVSSEPVDAAARRPKKMAKQNHRR